MHFSADKAVFILILWYLSDGVALMVTDGQRAVVAAQGQQVLTAPAAAGDPL